VSGAHRAAKTAGELASAFPKGNQERIRAASLLARCVPLAEKDAKLPEAKRKELARSYGDRAVILIKEAIRLGFKDIESLKKEPAMAALRAREDFQLLVRRQ
jgi:hypothetical protein